MEHKASCGLHESIKDRFQAISGKLFAQDTIDALALSLYHQPLTDGSRISAKSINSIAELQDHLALTSSSISYDTIILVPQEYSWGRFRITDSAFQVLIKSASVFVDFLVVVSAYGVKSSEDERTFYGWRSCALRKQCPKDIHEICYNIPYVDKHGRKLSDPWSLRQTGVYQQLYNNLRTSRWITLNLAERIKIHLKRFVESRTHCCRLALHAELLVAVGSNWTEYVQYLSTELRKLNDKACYSSVDQTKDHGYTVSYDDLQELHMLQAKMQRAEVALESSFDIARGCQRHFAMHSGFNGFTLGCKECNGSLDIHRADIKRHLCDLKRLDRRLQNTLNLLSKILMFRNEVLLATSNRAAGDTFNTLVKITEQGKTQQETLTQLLGTGQADSALVKALSMVATVCLPASLIATVFSSNLIQSVSQPTQASTYLVLSPQFWIYVAITLPLMGLTLAWMLYLDHKSQRMVYGRIAASNKKP